MSHQSFENHIDKYPREESFVEELQKLQETVVRESVNNVETEWYKGKITMHDGTYYGKYYINSAGEKVIEGQGTYTRTDGHIYEGEFQNGLPFDMFGKYTRPDATSYKGSFVNGFMGAPSKDYPEKENKAYGTYTRSDGTQYKGIFVDGKPDNGMGLLIHPNGEKENIARENGKPGYIGSDKRFHTRIFSFKEQNRLELRLYNNLASSLVVAKPSD